METTLFPLAQKLDRFISLTEQELTIIDRLHENSKTFSLGTELVHEGQKRPDAFILSEGWICSYKMLRGGGRQIVNFQIPGDFLGLRSVLLRFADHSFEPITRVEAAPLDAQDFLHTFEAHPRLATAVLRAASSDEAIMEERLVSLGRRDGVERTAHFLLELWSRLRLVGMAEIDSYVCPLSQYHLADALGLSAVHVNRVLRQLREENLLTFRKGTVTFNDFDLLVQLADFDSNYLDHSGGRLH